MTAIGDEGCTGEDLTGAWEGHAVKWDSSETPGTPSVPGAEGFTTATALQLFFVGDGGQLSA